MKTFGQFVLIAGILLAQGGASGMPKPQHPTPGTYNAPQVNSQIFQLEVDTSSNGSYRSIVTLHTPPVVVDQRPFKGHLNAQGQFCISPAPAHFADCFQVVSPNVLKTVAIDPRKAVELTRY